MTTELFLAFVFVWLSGLACGFAAALALAACAISGDIKREKGEL